jgi:hypothetical protein
MKTIKGQGALEYLIIVAAVLAIASVVVLFLTGAFGGAGTGASLSRCKQAAADCAIRWTTTVNPLCAECETACKDIRGIEVKPGAVQLCKQGEVTKVGAEPRILLFGPDCGTLSNLRAILNEKGFKYTDKAGTWTYAPTDDELKNYDVIIHFTDCWSTSGGNCTILKNAVSFGKAVIIWGNDNSPDRCDLCVIGKSYTNTCGAVSAADTGHQILNNIAPGSQLANNGVDDMDAGLADNAPGIVLGKCANGLAAFAVRTDQKVVQINAVASTTTPEMQKNLQVFVSNVIWYLFG